MVEPGDRSLMVTWTAPYAGHATLSIKNYDGGVPHIRRLTTTRTIGQRGSVMVTTNSAIISNLESQYGI